MTNRQADLHLMMEIYNSVHSLEQLEIYQALAKSQQFSEAEGMAAYLIKAGYYKGGKV